MWKWPVIIHFIIHVKYIKHRLALVGLEDAVLENEVTIVVNCYDVGSQTQELYESDIGECYCVEEFVRI
jgi:hypothetical protein